MITSEAELRVVVNRLTTLEIENRRLRRLIMGAGLLSIVSVAFVLAGSSQLGLAQGRARPLQEIQAYGFYLRDSEGRLRASLSFSGANESPMLAFSDSLGRPRLTMSADDAATSVSVYSPDGGRFELSLVASKDSAIAWAANVEKGAHRRQAQLFASADAAQLSAEDNNAFRTIIGNAAIESSRPGKTQWTSGASVVMYDTNGKVTWRAPASETGNAAESR